MGLDDGLWRGIPRFESRQNLSNPRFNSMLNRPNKFQIKGQPLRRNTRQYLTGKTVLSAFAIAILDECLLIITMLSVNYAPCHSTCRAREVGPGRVRPTGNTARRLHCITGGGQCRSPPSLEASPEDLNIYLVQGAHRERSYGYSKLLVS